MQSGKMYELWFRSLYHDLIEKRTLLAAVRPGDRRIGNPKGVSIFEIAKVRIIDTPGDEAAGLLPTFLDFSCEIKIVDIQVKFIKNLNQQDLVNCSPDSTNIEFVKSHLESIYNGNFNDEDIVTVLHWKYT